MAAAAPIPFSSSYDNLPRRPFSRAFAPTQASRPPLRRGSPLSSLSTANGASTYPPPARQLSIGDSSDDDLPVPTMKLSEEARAILGDDVSRLEISPIAKDSRDSGQNGSPVKRPPSWRKSSPFAVGTINRDASPLPRESKSPRVVRLSVGSTGSATLRRSVSTLRSRREGPVPDTETPRDLITPASRIRDDGLHAAPKRSGHAHSESKNLGSADIGNPGYEAQVEVEKVGKDKSNDGAEAIPHAENLAAFKSKPEETGVHGSLRIKRVGKISGRYLSGPARRGMVRRQSEEDQNVAREENTPQDENLQVPAKLEDRAGSYNLMDESPKEEDAIFRPLQPGLGRSSNYSRSNQPQIAGSSPILRRDPPGSPKTILSNALSNLRPTSLAGTSSGSSGKRVQPVFKVPPLPALPSRYDQENDPPPTFKRNKPNGMHFLDKVQKVTIHTDEKMLHDTPATISPVRKPLAPRSQNTPHRVAPAPPKMSILETATATAGASSASQSKKKRNYMSVNGKLFTRMDCIGRGGSSTVYRVMADNYKVFALKRVRLEDADELSVRGYKGEIDLLKRLENNERVVRLFDYEINDSKHTLCVLMEMGEMDLNRILTLRINAENAIFDISFTRHYWKEMLECVQAVHDHDIVHSDLKPANFLLVQGRLKLIDFGIANVIQDDTINVHREQQVGTPNYMAPEAITDSNAARGLPSSVGRLMKLGKPSDVWSLGCILYQMVYGKPPFAHIQQQIQRIMAIPDPNHPILYPECGVGGSLVPLGLKRTMRRCLNRDQTQRPMTHELLSETDPFLYPDAISAGTVPVSKEILVKLHANIVNQIRENGMPGDSELKLWPETLFNKLKIRAEEGRAL